MGTHKIGNGFGAGLDGLAREKYSFDDDWMCPLRVQQIAACGYPKVTTRKGQARRTLFPASSLGRRAEKPG